jgi:hypothetical protein
MNGRVVYIEKTNAYEFQLVTEMSTRNIKIMFLRSKARPVRGPDNVTTICEPIV